MTLMPASEVLVLTARLEEATDKTCCRKMVVVAIASRVCCGRKDSKDIKISYELWKEVIRCLNLIELLFSNHRMSCFCLFEFFWYQVRVNLLSGTSEYILLF